MRLRIQTGTNPYWDQPEEHDIFTDSDDKSQESSSTATTEPNDPQVQQIINPYTTGNMQQKTSNNIIHTNIMDPHQPEP